MIKIYSRKGCAYCPLVAKYLDILGAEYSVVEAEGDEYRTLANEHGVNVPLTVNTETGKAFMGWNPAKIKELVI